MNHHDHETDDRASEGTAPVATDHDLVRALLADRLDRPSAAA